MIETHERDAVAAEDKYPSRSPRLQFTLRQLILLTTFVAIFCSSFAWAGLFGMVAFLSLVSLGSLAVAIRAKRYGHAVLATIALMGCGLAFLAGSTVAIGDGHASRPLTFIVLEADDRTPISNAKVRIRDIFTSSDSLVLGEPIPKGEPGVEACSDSCGSVTLVYSYPATWRDGLFIHEHRVGFPWHWVRVSAPGHKPANFDLRDLIGRSVAADGFPLPPVKIQLQRETAHSDQTQTPPAADKPGDP